jgi:sugar O-acyltransferase (sialic acid O-acetyltransferase NeuD family)
VSGRAMLILGAGTFAVEALEAAELSGRTVRGFVVSDRSLRQRQTLEGLPVFLVEDLSSGARDVECVAAIVSTMRRAIVEAVELLGFTFGVLKHPTAIVSPRATLAPGAFVGAGAIVSANTKVGPHVIVNRGANIAHDVQLGPYVTIGPNAVLAGAVVAAARAWVGVGAVVRDHITIGEGAVVGAGAVVVKPVPAHTMVAGSPAAVIREGVDGY